MELPSKTSFFSDLNQFTDCDICFQGFDEDEHVAVQTKCQRVFGKKCLMEWAESKEENSNACPMCRTVLFIQPREPPTFTDRIVGYSDPKFSLDETNRFMRAVWGHCTLMRGFPEVPNLILEALVHVAMGFIGKRNRPYVLSNKISDVLEVVKDIIKEMCKDPSKRQPSARECYETWLPRFARATGWSFTTEFGVVSTPTEE